jgi:hypothetical protein
MYKRKINIFIGIQNLETDHTLIFTRMNTTLYKRKLLRSLQEIQPDFEEARAYAGL